MSFLAGFTSGGGVSGGDVSSSGGNADVRAATGNKNINIGGNPNVQSALQSPLVVIGLVVIAGIWLWRRK